MSEITQSLRKHIRLNETIFQSQMPSKKGKNIGPYQIQDFLEEGSYSKIYLAKSLYTNERVVIKAINKSLLKKELDNLLLITKQIETLKILKHRNIITLYEIYESRKYIYLITEYCQGKNLIEKLMRKKRFSEEEAFIIFFQLLDAFIYMHKMNICHRNIRAEHILFDKNGRLKLIGFGYSSFYEKNKKIQGAYGSLCYACPEIINEQPYNPELADVWSLGVILYVLVCGYLPFCEEEDSKNKDFILEGKIEFPKEMSNKLKDLLRHMLDINPEKRYNFQDIVKHPWIKMLKVPPESLFSQGINIHKTIYPVDENILNIINEYNFDKEKVKKDLINNKYNTGTGLYKQIVRKLLDMKIETISDLFCVEFNAYRDNKKNKYENGDKKYEDFIQKVSEYYNKKEDFVNDFKQREDDIVERLMALKEQKEEKKLSTIKEVNNSYKEDGSESNKNSMNQNIDTTNKDEQNINKELIDKSDKDNNQNISNNKKKLGLSVGLFYTKTNTVPTFGKLNKNLLKSVLGQKSSNDELNSKFRMTSLRRANTKTLFNKSTLYDNYLKQNHPENLKKTILKSRFGNINKKVMEDIKEKNESESEKEEKKQQKKEPNFEFDFDEIDEYETETEENIDNNDTEEPIDVIDGEGESQLFERFKEDNSEEIAELKQLWFGSNIKQSVNFVKKSILKNKSVKFNNNFNKNKNLETIKDEEKDNNNINNVENAKLRSKFKKSFKNDVSENNNNQKKVTFNNNKDLSEKAEVNKNVGNNYITNLSKNNRIDKINDFFIINLNNKKISNKNPAPDKKDESIQTIIPENTANKIINPPFIVSHNELSINNDNSNKNKEFEQIIVQSNEYEQNNDNSDLDEYFINENEPLNIQNKKYKSYLRKNSDEIKRYKKIIGLMKVCFFVLIFILVLLIYFR